MPATIFVLFACLGPHTTAILSQLVAVPILPPPAVTGYYLSPGHETFTFCPFTGETQRTPRDFTTFRLVLFTTFFTVHHSIFKTVLVASLLFFVSQPRLWASRDDSPAARVLSTGAAVTFNACCYRFENAMVSSKECGK